MQRPLPPHYLTGIEGALLGPRFEPARDLLEWAVVSFISTDGPLFNQDHEHLIAARIGMLWTNTANFRHGRRIVGQCEFKPPGGSMGKWQRARAQSQLHGWFGGDLDFLLTFDAQYASEVGDAEFCALVEHELYHCGQAKDEFGQPRFIEETGLPVFAMRGHDIEEFVGVVKRYGVVSKEIAALVGAAADVPAVSAENIRSACGTCHA